jgi:outer membrane protein TolC
MVMKGRTVVAGLLMTLLPLGLAAQQDVPRVTVTAQIAPSTDQVASSGSQVMLDELIKEGLTKNPAIQSATRRVNALRARIPQAKTLPDPTVSVGWMGDIAPFKVQKGDPSSYRSIGAMQEIPYPGKLKLRGQIADREAEAAWWEYEATRRRIVAEIKSAYYDYFFVSKATEITLKNKDLLQKLIKIAEAKYQVGQGLQQDVLKSQIELSRLLQRLKVLEQQKKTAQVRLNTLLYRSPEEPLGDPEPFSKAEFAYTVDELYEKALAQDPSLQREQRVIEQNQYAVNLARKEYYPDFSVGYSYLNRPAMPEMHGFTFTLNIPVFYKTKQREGVREATEGLLGAQSGRDDRKTTLFFEVKQLYLTARTSEDLATLYAKTIVPQSTLALESSLAAYQVGKLDFLTMITNFITVLDYEVNYYEELSNYQKALAGLEVFTGLELTK